MVFIFMSRSALAIIFHGSIETIFLHKYDGCESNKWERNWKGNKTKASENNRYDN